MVVKLLVCLSLVAALVGGLILSDSRASARLSKYEMVQMAIPEDIGVYRLEIDGMECIYVRSPGVAGLSCNWEGG